jgi:hypothetical protein
MAFNKDQFEDLIRRTLKTYRKSFGEGFDSDAAVDLLLGTAAQESDFGTYLKQIKGPAIGVFQMEPATFGWLCRKYGDKLPILKTLTVDVLEYNLKFAILLARLRYRVVPEGLPAVDDLDGLAAYYKKYYNTVHGKATVEQYIENYEKYVGAK